MVKPVNLTRTSFLSVPGKRLSFKFHTDIWLTPIQGVPPLISDNITNEAIFINSLAWKFPVQGGFSTRVVRKY